MCGGGGAGGVGRGQVVCSVVGPCIGRADAAQDSTLLLQLL